MAQVLQRIDAAVIDGRAQTPRYIQKQLAHLYNTLQTAQSSIRDAIRRDTGYSTVEVETEIYLTFKAIKQEYESIDFQKMIEQEYSLSHSKDNTSRRVPVGCVYIIPSQHTRFYSIIQPIAAAIASGNCVVIEASKFPTIFLRDANRKFEINQTLSELELLLKKLLTASMDKDTFAVVDNRPSETDLSRYCIVDGRSEASSFPNTINLVSATSSKSLAVVDRTAQISDAAREVVRASFSFNGRSPYSPKVVLVNEFALKEFCSAAARYAAEQVGSYLPNGNVKKPRSESNSDLQNEVQKSNSTTLFSGARGSIVLVHDRKSKLLTTGITDSVLLIHCIRSLDDAIDLTNNDISPSLPLNALYIFSDAPTAKYLSQFVSSRSSFTNHVPVDILVGPLSPNTSSCPHSIQPRYTRTLFSRPSPEYITPSSEHILLASFLDNDSSTAQISPAVAASTRKIKAEISTSLASMNEPAGQALGFFEQGLVTGASVTLTTLIVGLAVTGRYVVPAVLRRVR